MKSALWDVTIALLAAFFIAPGCSRQVTHPGDTVEAYVSAVESRDARAVYAMLDEASRRGMDEEAFEDYFRENYTLIREQARALEARFESRPMEITAEIPLDWGQSVDVAYVEDGWYLRQQVPTRSEPETPREAISAFVAALEAGDFETLLTLLSSSKRSAYMGELEALRDSVSEGLDNGIVTYGDRAVLPLDNGDKVILIREAGTWRILDFEQVDR